LGLDEKDNLVFFGAGVTNQEMDVEFKKLYDSLLYSALLQRLVAKECDQRRMVRKAGKESVLDQLRRGESPEMTVNQILQSRSESLKDSSKAD